MPAIQASVVIMAAETSEEDIIIEELSENQSNIKIAAAITVVHNPRLSPTADCVTLAVRTILFEIR
jgi:hypothetical protein